MNNRVSENLLKVKPVLFLIPLTITAVVAIFLAVGNAFSVNGYIGIQRELFFYLNRHLGQFPLLQYNLTEIGDTLVFLSLLSILLVKAPKLWGPMIYSLLLSLIISPLLKSLFSIPRPAAAFDPDTFIIVGSVLKGHNSLPSGHSITIFTVLTVVLLAFLPKTKVNRYVWCMGVCLVGTGIALSRVGVGAHYPLDVLAGMVTGFTCSVAGTLLNQRVKLWDWIGSCKYFPVPMILFLVAAVVLVNKILEVPLFIYFVALTNLTVSLYLFITSYAKKS